MFTIKLTKKHYTRFIEAERFSIVMNHEGNGVYDFSQDTMSVGFLEIANERIAFYADEEIQVVNALGEVVETVGISE